jgi:hypothetical protein
MASTYPKITFRITCTMNARWARQFLGMLKTMQSLGSMGSSREVAIYADGDGDFRPKFEWDEKAMGEFGIEPTQARIIAPHEKHFFDAG